MNRAQVEHLLAELAAGRVDVAKALAALTRLEDADLGFARVDHSRALRTGAAEVIFGAGKTPEQVARIAASLLDRGANVLCTRATPEMAAAVAEVARDARYDASSRCLVVTRHAPARLGRVAVACAGTSDLPVADEAAVSAEFFGAEVTRVTDVGVAGLQRLLARLDELRAADLTIVVAGMEGALASVLGGLTDRPVIAVPTSIGYGANLGGLTTLMAMLTSCASGVTVVNIDNGFGAAAAAQRILALRR